MNRLAGMVALGIIVASLGCGKESLPDKPQLIVDRDSIGFGQEFGSGTFIGSAPQDSLQIKNGGLEDLVITSATYTGEPAFVIEGPLSKTIKGKQATFIRIVFTPTAEKIYQGNIDIVSNAENAPMKKIAISGRGIKPGSDGGP